MRGKGGVGQAKPKNLKDKMRNLNIEVNKQQKLTKPNRAVDIILNNLEQLKDDEYQLSHCYGISTW